MEYFLDVLKNHYVDFNGRARRLEFWNFTLFYFITLIVVAGVDAVMGYSFLYMLTALFFLLPNFSVMIRRLHDTGKSGWWMLISLIPILGTIVLIVFLATDGTPGDNLYGPDPKELGEGLVSHHLIEDNETV